MDGLIERMAWDLGFAGRSARTRKVYLADVRAFLRFWKRPVEGLGQAEVRVWVEHLLAAGTSPSRLRQHLSALVFLFRSTERYLHVATHLLLESADPLELLPP